jgi:hypothetical protein
MTAYNITLFIYNIALIPVVFFSVLFLLLCLVNLFVDRKTEKFKPLKEFPFVSVQIPTFNDPIAERCVSKCMDFDYPKDKFEIVIVDDSTNIQTQMMLRTISEQNQGFVKYIHRDNREGFKPGALNNAMKITKGEILVVFDADWIPKKNFLKKIVRPFSDPNVAIVQTRQGFYNLKTNIVTRFAAYSLMIYHTIIMPINNKVNCVFFCGTAGALRVKHFKKVGGWNHLSITEDSELSVRLLMKGYKSVYLADETPSEVPDTFESFIKQQMRWCYGNARVFFDNAGNILFKKGLSIGQRIMILFITLANAAAPFVVIMTFFGFLGWFVGDPKIFGLGDLATFFTKFLYTAGFMIMAFITLAKHKRLREFGQFMLSSFTIGIVLSVSNSFAFIKAVFNSRLHWTCTPKVANKNALK